MLKVAIGSDHSAFKYRVEIKKELEKKNYKIKDFGIYEEKPSRNYEVAEKVALSVSNGESDRGILICGTGIGMSIVRKIIIMNGGSIKFSSEPGSGTRFSMDLPALF